MYWTGVLQWAGVLPRGIRILMEAMRQDRVVEAVGHEDMPLHTHVPYSITCYCPIVLTIFISHEYC